MRMAFKRGIIVLIGLILQLLMYSLFYLFLADKIFILNFVYRVIGIILFLHIVKDSKSYSYTLPVMLILLLYPIAGAFLYILLWNSKIRSKTLKSIIREEKISKKYYDQDEKVKEIVKENNNIKYLTNYEGFSLTLDNDIKYYSLAIDAFVDMKKELKKAEKYIFLEYFIIAPGKMWGEILSILEEKAKNGVIVRIIYDDVGCLPSLPDTYKSYLKSKNIDCVVFNELSPLRGVMMNNRDHRKILVIDGKVAFTGGFNLSDSYINVNKIYGFWKDNGIRIKGNAVWSYVVMFLCIWNSYKHQDKNYEEFKYIYKNDGKKKGYAIPYADSPLDEDITGENVYLNLINGATEYIYIFTPYLIIDIEMRTALSLAVKRGVDVRVIIPGIPDKKMVYTLTESYAEILLKDGVKVYKYTPGFLHSKTFVVDGNKAVVGTINMDYRSLYLHFECALYMEDVDVIKDIEKDFLDTIKESRLLTKEDFKPNVIKAIWQAMLRLIAPLL